MLFAWGENAELRAFAFDPSGHVKLLAHGSELASGPLATALDRLGLREGWRCVDVGAGGGDVTVALAEVVGRDGRVYAVDSSPTMHRLGATRFRDAWVLRTLPDQRGRLPSLRRAQCTGAIVQRMLLHLAHPCLIVGSMTEARRVLRPGAPLAIVEADTRTGQGSGADGEPYVEHYRLRDGTTLPTTAWRHSPATIVSCLASAGFVVDEIHPLAVPAEADAASILLYLARAA